MKAIDISSQKTVASKIEQLLLDETPMLIPYNYDALTAMKKNIKGIETTGMGHVNLNKAGITS